jgi:uncharacterized membrane protein HdeD (DUF308 family)
MKNIFIINEKRNYWWLLFVAGLLFVLFGFWMLFSPLDSMRTLITVFGIFTLLGGIFEMLFSISNRDKLSGYRAFLFGGVFDVGLGLLLIINPKILLVLITFVISIWIIQKGANKIHNAFQQRRLGDVAWKPDMWYGFALILLAGLLLWHPEIIGITIAFWTALAFIILGGFRMAMALNLKRGYVVV